MSEGKVHELLLKAIEEKDYQTICNFLCSECYGSDSEWVVKRVRAAFISGWKERERISALTGDASSR